MSPYAVMDVQGEVLCGLCQRIKPEYAKAAAYGSYEGGLRDLLHLLKYERIRPASRVLGRMLSEVIAGLAGEFGETVPLVIPVPLHERKLRERGFNQSELIAQEALKLKPAGLDLQLKPRMLKRSRATQSQTGLSSHQRRENMRGAFTVGDASEIAGRNILLVDDVFTTGTTVSECARQLRRAGAARVWVATVARTLKASATRAEFVSHEKGKEVNAAAMAAHV